MEQNIFKKYHSRLAREGWLKALVCGLITGFAAMFVAAFITWFFPLNGVWIAIAALAVGALISTPIFYFKLFRPTTKDIARRVDRLGLEERLITMLELEKDESYIALRQREDAKEKLSTVDSKRLTLRLSRATLIAAAIVAVLGLSMTTVSALSAEGVVPGGGDVVDKIKDPIPKSYTVDYEVEEGGSIMGEASQVVFEGEDAETVVAVADDGYAFVGWDDDFADPSRTDINIHEDLVFMAIFEQVEESESEDGNGEGQEGEPGDEPQQGDSENNQPSDPQEGSNAGGRYEESNSIIDGETYYRDPLEAGYLEQAMEALSEGRDIPPELRDFIESYFDIIL